MRFVYLVFAILLGLMFLTVAITDFTLLSLKSVIGFAFLELTFLGGYFRLNKEQRTVESSGFQRRLHMYDELAPIGANAALAEEKMASVARFTKAENQIRLFTRSGSHRFRIAYFLGPEADARVVSLGGQVVDLEVFPHEK